MRKSGNVAVLLAVLLLLAPFAEAETIQIINYIPRTGRKPRESEQKDHQESLNKINVLLDNLKQEINSEFGVNIKAVIKEDGEKKEFESEQIEEAIKKQSMKSYLRKESKLKTKDRKGLEKESTSSSDSSSSEEKTQNIIKEAKLPSQSEEEKSQLKEEEEKALVKQVVHSANKETKANKEEHVQQEALPQKKVHVENENSASNGSVKIAEAVSTEQSSSRQQEKPQKAKVSIEETGAIVIQNAQKSKFHLNIEDIKASTHVAQPKILTVEAPAVKTPALEASAVEVPAVEVPVVEAPVVEAPVVEAPVVEAPVVEAPVVAIQSEIPSTTNTVADIHIAPLHSTAEDTMETAVSTASKVSTAPKSQENSLTAEPTTEQIQIVPPQQQKIMASPSVEPLPEPVRHSTTENNEPHLIEEKPVAATENLAEASHSSLFTAEHSSPLSVELAQPILTEENPLPAPVLLIDHTSVSQQEPALAIPAESESSKTQATTTAAPQNEVVAPLHEDPTGAYLSIEESSETLPVISGSAAPSHTEEQIKPAFETSVENTESIVTPQIAPEITPIEVTSVEQATPDLSAVTVEQAASSEDDLSIATVEQTSPSDAAVQHSTPPPVDEHSTLAVEQTVEAPSAEQVKALSAEQVEAPSMTQTHDSLSWIPPQHEQISSNNTLFSEQSQIEGAKETQSVFSTESNVTASSAQTESKQVVPEPIEVTEPVEVAQPMEVAEPVELAEPVESNQSSFMASICMPMCDYESSAPVCEHQTCRACRSDNECIEELSIFEAHPHEYTISCDIPTGKCNKEKKQ